MFSYFIGGYVNVGDFLNLTGTNIEAKKSGILFRAVFRILFNGGQNHSYLVPIAPPPLLMLPPPP